VETEELAGVVLLEFDIKLKNPLREEDDFDALEGVAVFVTDIGGDVGRCKLTTLTGRELLGTLIDGRRAFAVEDERD